MAKIEVQILDYIDKDNIISSQSVIGTLDITDSENFPLAISYLISDGRDLEQRFGDFSKSFEIPATKNNNKLFRNICNEKIVDVNNISGFKDCRILVDSIDFLRGKIQIKGSKQSSEPLSYSCTVYGGNYGWISGLKDRDVCDIFGGRQLLLNNEFLTQISPSGGLGNWTYGWGLGNDWVWANGQIVWSAASSTTQFSQNITSINGLLVVGALYEVSFEITDYTSGSLGGRVTNSAAKTSVWTGANGVGVWSYQFLFGDAGTTFQVLNRLRFRLESEAGGFVGTVDNISLKAIKTLEYTKDNIINSWTDTQATNDIVYPLIDYGEWSGGDVYFNGVDIMKHSANSYEVYQQKNMRPSFYLYNMIKELFNNVGYQIESNFIEDADFKKLICHFPPDKQKLNNQTSEVMISRNYWNEQTVSGGNKGMWDSSLVGLVDYQILVNSNAKQISSTVTDTGWKTIKNDLTISDINGDYDSSTGYWTCPIDGYYDISSVTELIIGNFTNNQTSVRNAGCRINVYMRIVVESFISGFGTIAYIAQTSEENSKVGGWDYSNYIGNNPTTSSSVQYPSESKIPILNAVGVGISSPYAMKAGDKVKIQVKVKVQGKGASGDADVRWGVAALNDNFNRSITGDDGFKINFGYNSSGGFQFPYNCQSSYKDDDCLNVDNLINMWELFETPYFKITPISTDYSFGETYKYSDILPCNISQLDLIKGVSHLFNLQFRTDMNTNTVYIEPFDEFYKDESLAYDWTNKLDLSKEIEDKYEINLKDKLSFQYKNDGSDGLMKYINQSFKEAGNQYNFFNYYEELGENYPKGMNSFVNPIFSSTWCDWDPSIQHLNPPLVPVINKEESLYGWDLWNINGNNVQRPDKIYKYSPRILLYQGYIDSPNSSNLDTGWNYWTRVSGSINRILNQSTQTPRATFVDWDNNSGDKFTNLSFNDEIINPPLSGNKNNKKGLYTTYWKPMIDQLKKNPRIRVMSINLSPSDIINLDLSKLVYINGTYWRINRVMDYAPLKNITTKVEFIQWGR